MPRPCEHCHEQVNQPPIFLGEPPGATDAHGIAWELLPPGIGYIFTCPMCGETFSHGVRVYSVGGHWTHVSCLPAHYFQNYAQYAMGVAGINPPAGPHAGPAQPGWAAPPQEVLEAMANKNYEIKKKRRKVDVLFPAGEIPRRRGAEPHG